MPKLIITNGDGAAHAIRVGGITGHLVEWRDFLHDGPVPSDDSLEMVSDVRAGFISDALGREFDDVRADFATRDKQLGAHIAYGEVELWFEHDLYDQLQLIQLLDYFAREPERLGVKLVQADNYIAVLDAAAIRALEPTAAPVSSIQLEAGRQAWAAFTAPDPRALAALASAPVPELPFLAPALRRALSELPAPRSGLSLTQERALRALEEGPQTIGRLFGAVTAQDAAQFLGDVAFFLRLDALAFVPTPLISGVPFPASACPSFTPSDPPSAEEQSYRAYARAEIALTDAGRAALAGTFDHVVENGIDQWFGGTHLHPGAVWRYDRAAGQLVAPDGST